MNFPFQVLSLHETLTAYRSVYYIGTIVPIIVLLFGYIVKPPRRSKAQTKEQ